MALKEQGSTEEEAYSKIWMVDSRGLIVKVRTAFPDTNDQCTYRCFNIFSYTTTGQNILSKPLAAFPHKHQEKNGQSLEKSDAITIITHRK